MKRSILFAGMIGIAVAVGILPEADAQQKLGRQCKHEDFNACFSCCTAAAGGAGDKKELNHCEKRCAKVDRKFQKKQAKRASR